MLWTLLDLNPGCRAMTSVQSLNSMLTGDRLFEALLLTFVCGGPFLEHFAVADCVPCTQAAPRCCGCSDLQTVPHSFPHLSHTRRIPCPYLALCGLKAAESWWAGFQSEESRYL